MQDSFLIDIWREACKHIELHDSTVAISKLVARRVPIGQILVRRFNSETSSLITVAGQTAGSSKRLSEDKQPLSKPEAKRVEDWCNQTHPLHVKKRATGLAKLLVPESIDNSCVLIPLSGRFGSRGILLISPRGEEEFTADEMKTLASLREPFAVALDNDLHVHEITALRAAAESDRGALLQKLGRKELADVIVGEQSGLRMVMQRIELVAGSDVPVLILGETEPEKSLLLELCTRGGEILKGPLFA